MCINKYPIHAKLSSDTYLVTSDWIWCGEYSESMVISRMSSGLYVVLQWPLQPLWIGGEKDTFNAVMMSHEQYITMKLEPRNSAVLFLTTL